MYIKFFILLFFILLLYLLYKQRTNNIENFSLFSKLAKRAAKFAMKKGANMAKNRLKGSAESLLNRKLNYNKGNNNMELVRKIQKCNANTANMKKKYDDAIILLNKERDQNSKNIIDLLKPY